MAVALLLLLGGAIVYTAHVTVGLGGNGHQGLWSHWVYDGVIGAAGGLCLLRATAGDDRAAWGLIGLAICVYWLGDLYWNNNLAGVRNPPYPSWADAGWLAYYVPLYVGIMMLLRSRVSGLSLSVWLEGIVGALALGSVAATIVFDPLVASTHGSVSTVLTNLAYPTLDVLLLALVAGAFVIVRQSQRGPWMLLGLGLLVAGAADSVYLVQAANGTYAEGGWVNAGWPLAFTVMAFAAWSRRRDPAAAAGVERARLSVLSGLFALLILGLLGYGTFAHVSPVAHVLVTLAVVALFARAALATRERQLLARRTTEARTDDLTGLANRRALYEAVDQALEQCAPTALLFIDLDRFTDLADTLGRGAGDDLLRHVASRLRDAIPEGSVLARLENDDFVLLVGGVDPGAAAMAAATAIRTVLEQSFAVDGLLITIRASIGIARASEAASTRIDLLRCADVAMCRARSRGSGVELYDEEENHHGRDQLRLVSELRSAIESDELELHYQPKVAVADARLAGVEALVRWRHPRLGLLQPGAFVPLAEREGMMRALTLAVLDRALAQQRAWRLGGICVPVAVNLSPANLMDTRLPTDVGDLLRRHATPPDQLELEITEETLMRDLTRGLDVIARIGELGVEFSLDDFGTGYSSLSQLRRLPVRALKIDRSFIANITESIEDQRIVESTVQLGHSLNLRVIAEGVETSEHLEALALLGCDTAQGYHIARPMPSEGLIEWLKSRAGPAAGDCALVPATRPGMRSRSALTARPLDT